jgi:hypothetical protein
MNTTHHYNSSPIALLSTNMYVVSHEVPLLERRLTPPRRLVLTSLRQYLLGVRHFLLTNTACTPAPPLPSEDASSCSLVYRLYINHIEISTCSNGSQQRQFPRPQCAVTREVIVSSKLPSLVPTRFSLSFCVKLVSERHCRSSKHIRTTYQHYFPALESENKSS